MPSSVTISGHGFDGPRVERAFRAAAFEQMQSGMHAVEAVTRARAPYRTGHLRRSIISRVYWLGNTLIGVIGTTVFYAPYLEMGTGLYGPRNRPIVPVKARALRFPAGGTASVFSGGRRMGGTAGPGFRLSGQQRAGTAGSGANWVFARSVKGIKPIRFFRDSQEIAKGQLRRSILVIPVVAQKKLSTGAFR